MKQACNITLVAALSCAAMTLTAQPAVDAGIAECAAIESAVARLDCFDALARKMRAAEPDRVVTVAPAASEPAREPQRRDAGREEREEREQVSQVAALRQIQPGRLEVTLTNGQVWRQTNSDRYNLVVGHEVKIYPTAFGEYFRLSSTQARGFIQVERVR
jgi:hypothetical protein